MRKRPHGSIIDSVDVDDPASNPPTPLPVGGEPVTARSLFAEHLRGRRAAPVGQARRPLLVGGIAVASVGADPSQVTPLCALSGTDLPIFDVLAGLAAQQPSGVLVIEADHGSLGFAFSIRKGRIVGARGPAPIDELGAFLLETRRTHPQRLSASQGPERVAREFVHERALDHLDLARSPGSRMTFVRGDVSWLGPRIADESGISIEHLLLEHARRFDELPRILERLGPLQQVVAPVSEPQARPQPRASTGPSAGGAHDWDFVSDPDDAAMSEWSDAQTVWALCDGRRSIEQIVDGAMLGQFRGLAALAPLISRGCVRTVAPAPGHAESGAAAPIPQPTANVIKIRDSIATPRPSGSTGPTAYSYVKRKGSASNLDSAPPVSRDQLERDADLVELEPPVLEPPPMASDRAAAPIHGFDTEVVDVPLPPSAASSARLQDVVLSSTPPPEPAPAPSRGRRLAVLLAVLTGTGIVGAVVSTADCHAQPFVRR